MKVTKATKQLVYAAARTDFKSFVRLAFGCVFPSQVFVDNFHIDAICHQMNLVKDGKCRRLAVNLPPRTLKSFIISVAFPAFILGQDPAKQFLIISHNEALANEHSGLFRKLVASPDIKYVFPTLNPAPTKNTERVYKTSKGGGRQSVTTHSGVTGLGADYIILDDPISAQDAFNESACGKTGEWICQSAMTRFNNPSKGVVLLVMQRLSIWDPHATLTSLGGWETLILPARTDKTRNVGTGPNLSHKWGKGKLLDPERLPENYLSEQNKTLGGPAYMAQFLQAPVPFGGGLIDVGQFNFFKSFPRKKPDSILISVDPAGGGVYSKSYSVILVLYVFDGHLYLYGRWRKKDDFANLKAQTIGLIQKFQPHDLIIEHTSSGPPLASEVHEFIKRRNFSGQDLPTRLHPFKPTRSKEARWTEASLLLSQGRVHLPDPTLISWVSEFIDECRAFPEGKTDDQVDALSQALVAYHRLYDHKEESKVHFF